MPFCLFIILLFSLSVLAAEPLVKDARYVLTRVAAEPDIVTPIGLEFDHKGRLLVIESHTHFPLKNYAGPKADRIRIVEDSDGDGKADGFRTFFEGTTHTMSLARGPENWMYVATRMKIFRIRDTNGDDVADADEELAHLETTGTYPHDGLCGLCFDGAGGLYFGFGENLGEPYKLIGRDGVTLSGGGEGGNIYHCRADGSQLERVATGVWNPFAICVDAHGRVFTVDNDPDARPPCRLLHVVPTADYGFQFKLGRSGVNPLLAWNGELPGTLPMLAGTGEAPCDALPYHGALWVTCWGENRVDRYTLLPAGNSLRATCETVVQGDQMFRPVDFAVAPDGSLYFTDWVDKSYNVHSKGRIWKLASKDAAQNAPAWPALTPGEEQARAAEKRLDLELLKSPDAMLRQSAVAGLARAPELATLRFATLAHPLQRLGLLQAHKWNGNLTAAERDALLTLALADADTDVCLFAVRWAADHDLADFRPKLDDVLKRSPMPAALFQVTLAAMDWLDLVKSGVGVKKLRQRSREQYLADTLNAATTPAATRALALRMLPADHAYLTLDRLKTWANTSDTGLQREAVRALAMRKNADAQPALAELAGDQNLSPALRADAVMGLAGRAEHQALLNELSAKGPPPVQAEARRGLRNQPGQVLPAEAKPSPDASEAWLKLLGDSGDADAGWRVYFSSQGARCSSCHAHSGRGSSIGPDLTGTGKSMNKQRLLESILRPSKEIAPIFTPWILRTTDGRALTGIPVHAVVPGAEEKFVGSDGQTFALKPQEIASRKASPLSLMPDGLEQTMTVQDLRDLLAFLERGE